MERNKPWECNMCEEVEFVYSVCYSKETPYNLKNAETPSHNLYAPESLYRK